MPFSLLDLLFFGPSGFLALSTFSLGSSVCTSVDLRGHDALGGSLIGLSIVPEVVLTYYVTVYMSHYKIFQVYIHDKTGKGRTINIMR